jgi:hypothetical protein
MKNSVVGIDPGVSPGTSVVANLRLRAVRATAVGALLPALLVACGGGGGSAPVAPKTASLLSISSPVAKQSASGQTLLVFRAALLSSASFPVDVAFTTSGGRVGASCSGGIDYLIAAAGGTSVSIEESANAKGVLTLASAASNRQISVLACPGAGDKALTLTWNDGAASGSAVATVRGSANTSLAGSMPLNDTGITACATDSANNLACPQAGFGGQDGDTGRDANVVITGQGAYRGSAFALNKLPGAECIQDGVTGLTWEGKTGSGLHAPAATFTWFDSNASTNGGSSGTPGTASGGVCTGSACDTEQFVAAVNAEALCGYGDWRLPTAQELGGIVDAGASAAPTISALFENQAAAPYWTASPRAADADGAWVVNFSSGAIGGVAKSLPSRVRLVRGH